MGANLTALAQRLHAAGRSGIERRDHRLETSAARLHALSPESTLARGFAIARDSLGRVVRDAQAVAPGDDLEIILSRGSLDTAVKKVDPAGGIKK
jgi:exodeoxyribonuclease VII large subunit